MWNPRSGERGEVANRIQFVYYFDPSNLTHLLKGFRTFEFHLQEEGANKLYVARIDHIRFVFLMCSNILQQKVVLVRHMISLDFEWIQWSNEQRLVNCTHILCSNETYANINWGPKWMRALTDTTCRMVGWMDGWMNGWIDDEWNKANTFSLYSCPVANQDGWLIVY